jgi:hypothetical protein
MCPTSLTARSEATTDIVLMDIDKSPDAAFEVSTLGAFDSHERIISEFTRPPIFHLLARAQISSPGIADIV